jgi:hypothetical protein
VKELPTLPRLFATTVYIRVRAVVTGLDHPVQRNRSSKTIADPASPKLDRLPDPQPFAIAKQSLNKRVPAPSNELQQHDKTIIKTPPIRPVWSGGRVRDHRTTTRRSN